MMQSFKQFLLEADLTDKETEELLAKHLTADQIEKLSKIKSRGKDKNAWQKGYKKLIAYKEKHKDTNVPWDHVTKDGYTLGSWFSKQKTSKRKGNLDQDREKLLVAIGFEWVSLDAKWEESYSRLVAYKEKEGHTNVPRKHVTEDGSKLGGWVHRQREKSVSYWENEKYSHRKEKLDNIGFVWDSREANWLENYYQLVAYKEKVGNPHVPTEYVTNDGSKLGHWVDRQRQKPDTYWKNKKHSYRKEKLDDIDFEWDGREAELKRDAMKFSSDKKVNIGWEKPDWKDFDVPSFLNRHKKFKKLDVIFGNM